MSLTVHTTPAIVTADDWTSRWLGVSTPNVLELLYTPVSYTALSVAYSFGSLTFTMALPDLTLLNVGDGLSLDFGGTSFAAKITAIDTNTGEVLTDYGGGAVPSLTFEVVSPVSLEVRVTVRNQGTGEARREDLRVNADGLVRLDLSPLVRPWLRLQSTWDFTTAQFREANWSVEFTVSWQGFVDGQPSLEGSIPEPFYATLAAFQNLRADNSNMVGYLPIPNPIGQSLNELNGKIPVWSGYPAWLDVIQDPAASNDNSYTFGATTIAIDNSEGAGVYRLDLSGVDLSSGTVCGTSTGTGGDPGDPDPPPPPVAESKIFYGYHFRGLPSQEPEPPDPIDPPPPPPDPLPADCGKRYAEKPILVEPSDSTGQPFWHPVDSQFGSWTLAPGELLLFGLNTTGGGSNFCPVYGVIAKQVGTTWQPVAQTNQDITQAFSNFIAPPFTGASFPHAGFVTPSRGAFPLVGANRLPIDQATWLGDPTRLNCSDIFAASAGRNDFTYLGYRNKNATAEVVRLWLLVPPPSPKYARNPSPAAIRICPTCP